jgi:hypothetical protein
MADGSAPEFWCFDQGEAALDPVQVTEVLRRLAESIRTLSRATVFYRILMGRHLIVIQKNELWRLIERRDYRQDPNGKPVWLSPTTRTYASWYNFIEQGFENITGLHRQTAYSALRLAQSHILSTLTFEDLLNFKRLANALELVAAERKGISITPELVVQAQEMPIKHFRRTAHATKQTVPPMQQVSTLRHITNFLRGALTINPRVIDDLWAIIQDATVRANEDPVRAVEDIISAYSASMRTIFLSDQVGVIPSYRAANLEPVRHRDALSPL